MKASYHPDYFLPLPDGHPFPMAKYPLVREQLRACGLLDATAELVPEEAAHDDLARVHTAGYLARLFGEGLTAAEVRALGVPWTAKLLRRSRLAVQGTLLAARAALAEGLAGNLAGGTHHAFADHGEGFCVLNDVAVAIRCLQAEGRIRRALVIDLDVHQGNGTAAIFEGDDSVFTFSMHGERNYPVRKMRSTLDVGLPDGTDDAAYLGALAAQLPRLTEGFRPDLVFYLAGVDVAAGDRYGRFALSDAGLRERERQVLGWARTQGLPLTVTLAGGYAATPERTAALHAMVFEEAAA
ncbi:MAG: histone deacetylase [Xanthomonadales bacterium]|nr:histone deacetylase [Xanthomonadales bacterium]